MKYILFICAAILLCNCGGSSNTPTTPPVSQIPTAIISAAASVNEMKLVTLDASNSTDPQGQSLTYSWNQISGPSVTIDGNTSASISILAPEVTEDQTAVFELVVSDGTNSNRISHSLTFLNIFTSPRLNQLEGFENIGNVLASESSLLNAPIRLTRNRTNSSYPHLIIETASDGSEYVRSKIGYNTNDMLAISTSLTDFEFSAGAQVSHSTFTTIISDLTLEKLTFFQADSPFSASSVELEQKFRADLDVDGLCNTLGNADVAKTNGIILHNVASFHDRYEITEKVSIPTTFEPCHFAPAWRVFNQTSTVAFTSFRRAFEDILAYNEDTGEIFHFSEEIDPVTQDVGSTEVAKKVLNLNIHTSTDLEVVESRGSPGQLQLLLSDKSENKQHRLVFAGLDRNREIVYEYIEFTGEVPTSFLQVGLGTAGNFMVLSAESPEAQIFRIVGTDAGFRTFDGPYFLEVGFGASEGFPISVRGDDRPPELLIVYSDLGKISVLDAGLPQR